VGGKSANSLFFFRTRRFHFFSLRFRALSLASRKRKSAKKAPAPTSAHNTPVAFQLYNLHPPPPEGLIAVQLSLFLKLEDTFVKNRTGITRTNEQKIIKYFASI
jgi:hypothetical protein